MITRDEVGRLLLSGESFRVERTVSTTDTDKFCEAICAFANDMPASGKPGYLLVGVDDDGRLSGLKATDGLLKNLASIRSDGNILPMPVMSVESFTFEGGDVIAVEVEPSIFPPVRYRGRTWIRIGPRRSIATREEEDRLVERRSSNFPTFDSTPCVHATLDDLDLDAFRDYLRKAVAVDVLDKDDRPIRRQLESLSFFSTRHDCPTYAGLILFGRAPERFLFGDYVQFVQFAGADVGADVENQQEFRGNLITVLPQIDTFIRTSIARKRPVPVSLLREEMSYDYPWWPIRELVMNAVMHRDYKGNAPTKFYQYADRLEITNPGGLYGKVSPENFPNVTDYRNPIIAGALSVLGYVNKFGRGIGRVQKELAENGNPPAVFSTEWVTVFTAKVLKAGLDGEKVKARESAARLALKEALKCNDASVQDRYLAVFDLLAKNGGVTFSAINGATGISRRSVADYVDFMQKLGVLKRIGSRKTGQWLVCDPKATDQEGVP